MSARLVIASPKLSPAAAVNVKRLLWLPTAVDEPCGKPFAAIGASTSSVAVNWIVPVFEATISRYVPVAGIFGRWMVFCDCDIPPVAIGTLLGEYTVYENDPLLGVVTRFEICKLRY